MDDTPGTISKGNFRRRQRLGLLAAAPEDVRVAALEPDDAFARARPGDEQRGDFLLRHGHVFAARNQFGGRRREAEQFGIGERVIDHHVGAAEQFRAAQREQPRVARPGADEINRATGFHAHSLITRRLWAMKDEPDRQFNQPLGHSHAFVTVPPLIISNQQRARLSRQMFRFLGPLEDI